MRIEVKGRHFPVTDELRECVERRFEMISRQVSDVALLELELSRRNNAASPETCVADAELHLKGITLRARHDARDAKHAINLAADDMSRQVKRHRDKRRNRREARAAAAPPPGSRHSETPAPPGSLPAM